MKLMFLLLFGLGFISHTFALEIDEKLTLRIVGTSESKKTILINRGIEDGLVKGDHAKFFVSQGVIGRAVCIKLSPTRSVWSVYRKVNADFLREEQVMKLKITPAVKITKDESRMLVSEDTSSTPKDPRDLGIPLAEGANDLDQTSSKDLTKEEEAFFNSNARDLTERNKEIFGMLHYSSLTEETGPDNETGDYVQDVTNLMLKVGGEYYFSAQKSWLSRFSLLASFTIDRRATMSHLGTHVQEESSEFGAGISMYPFAMPTEVYRLIQYVNYTFSLGSTNSTYNVGAENAQNVSDSVSLDASVLSHQFIYGIKYYAPNGFGARLELSYYLRADQYATDSSEISWLKTRTGPRFQVGFGYRF
ncbi:MAG: hypothetical protein CME66_03360 [Halobacteriovoraceae bacterium]|nr:hypothetical protein [Halobacteriovoraceae bacterium]